MTESRCTAQARPPRIIAKEVAAQLPGLSGKTFERLVRQDELPPSSTNRYGTLTGDLDDWANKHSCPDCSHQKTPAPKKPLRSHTASARTTASSPSARRLQPLLRLGVVFVAATDASRTGNHMTRNRFHGLLGRGLDTSVKQVLGQVQNSTCRMRPSTKDLYL